jgi:hypothetical protein
VDRDAMTHAANHKAGTLSVFNFIGPEVSFQTLNVFRTSEKVIKTLTVVQNCTRFKVGNVTPCYVAEKQKGKVTPCYTDSLSPIAETGTGIHVTITTP